MASSDKASDDSLYPIAVLIDELKTEDIQVSQMENISWRYKRCTKQFTKKPNNNKKNMIFFHSAVCAEM